MKKHFLLASCLIICSFFCYSQASIKFTEELKKQMRQQVFEAAKHAWKGYRTYAQGYDDLQPLTKNGKNWYKHSLLMTPVDSYDSFILLGMKKEAKEAKKLILSKLNFNVDNEVQVFEITIRLLGGLISAYEMDGDKKFLDLAVDLANRLLPAFNSPTGMPYRYVHLQSGAVRDSINNPAEIGTLMMEFGQLSRHTGQAKYYDVAKKAMMELFKRRSTTGLVGLQIDVTNGEWKNPTSQIGAYIDSYYEYLFKSWKLFGDEDFKKAWEVHHRAILYYLISKEKNGWFMKQVDMNTGNEISTVYGALDAFYAGLSAYAGDVETARKNQMANYYMWTHFGMEPEAFNFRTNKILNGHYILRPENIESCFYLYHTTKDDEYLWMAKKMFDDINKNCKHEAGFASVKNIETMEKQNSMQSFFIAETLKYAYLIFADKEKFNLDQYVFNTEAHPFKIKSDAKGSQ